MEIDEDSAEGIFLNEEDVVELVDVDEEDGDATELDLLDDLGEDDSIHLFTGHSDSIFSLACSPIERQLVASGGGDDTVFIWKVGEGDAPVELKGHEDSVAALAFSNDGMLLASGGLDGVVNIWDVNAHSIRSKLDGPSGGIEWLKWHPRGQVVLAGSEDYTAWMWNAVNGTCMKVFSGHSGSVTCGNFTPDGRVVCTGSDDGSFRVWNARSGETSYIVHGHPYHTEGLTCLDIHNDSAIAMTGSTDGSACLVNIQNGKVIGSLKNHENSVESVGFSSSLPLAATGSVDAKLIIWDLQTLQARSICEHKERVMKLIWSASQIVITGCGDGKVRLWDGRTGACVRTFSASTDDTSELVLSMDEKFIIAGYDDSTVRVFEI